MRALLLAAAMLSVGCAATTVHSGRPPRDVAPGYEERWHSAFLWGTVPLGPPYDMARICPAGWAQVTVARDPFTLLVGVVTLFVYSPSRVTVVCALPGAAHPPPEGYAPSAPAGPPMPPAPVSF